MDEEYELTIPDVVTASNALLGFLAMTYMIDAELWIASMLILIGILVDGLDGRLARFLGVEHDLGAYLDMFSDMVTFCFAPSLLLYSVYYDKSLGSAWQSPQNLLATLIPAVVVFFGTLRLSRFADTNPEGLLYQGIPTPLMALVIIIFSYLFGYGTPLGYRPFLVLSMIGLLSPLLYTEFRYPKINGPYWTAGGAMVLLLTFFAFLGTKISYPSFYLLFLPVLLICAVYIVVGPYVVDKYGIGKRDD